MNTILFDIGGTHTRIARVDGDAQKLLDRIEYETPQDFDEAILKMKREMARITTGTKPTALCGSFPGKWNKETGVITYAPHLPGWVGKSFKEALLTGELAGIPLFLENDAALAGLGEAVHGAGAGKNIVAYLTVSTGIGGARIVHGKIDASHDGYEPGHQIVDWKTGETLEDLVSGTGIKARYENEIQKITDSAQRDEAARILAVGIHNVIVHWSPDIVVLGGPVILNEPGIDLGIVRGYVSTSLGFAEVPEIVPAKLGGDAGLVGAGVYAGSQS